MYIRCSKCGHKVSVAIIPDGTIIRAYIECPECVESSPDFQKALQQFTECPGWRVFLHDEDCADPDNEGQHPDDSRCSCDGTHRIRIVENALRNRRN